MSNLATTGDSAGMHPERAGELRELTLGNVNVDLATFKVIVAARPERLTYQEFELLRHLAGFRDRVVPFDVLNGLLWGATGQKQTRRLNVLVCRLRAKLRSSNPYRLETVRGRGYGLLGDGPAAGTAGSREGGAA